MQKCKRCNGKIDLHVGDRIAFAHNKTYHSHSDLMILADSKGLFTSTADYVKSKYSVINPNGATPKDYQKPCKLNIKVLTPQQFKLLLKSVCDGQMPVVTKPPLKSILEINSRIYPLELSELEKRTLNNALTRYGAKVSKQRRQSIAAVVCPERHLNSGRAKLFKFWGIPVYSYSRIIKTL